MSAPLIVRSDFEIGPYEWYTPDWLFQDLAKEFGPFDLDAAALPVNAKCGRFYTPEDDGKECAWFGRVWCNPPYRNILSWVEKAYREVTEGRAERVVMLLPAQTSTKWFHDYVLPYAKLKWIRGKVQFGGCKDRAIMPSLVVVFDPASTSVQHPGEEEKTRP